ncbi:MAG: proteasome accessory factor PafA2 [Nitrospinota bacterium]|nr:MAG: proteasome accessory factor PafA2 [Nitrospinota bacterium]
MAIQKIMGSETEYGITVRNDPDFDPISKSLLLINSYQTDPLTRFLWDYDQEDPLVDARGFELDEEFEVPDQQDNMSINKILPNGARYYLDHAHPEFSTPECSNPRDVVCYEKAGERILDISRIRAEHALPTEQRILIYKNNSDRKGNSYGCHENYLMDRSTPFNLIIEHLIPFLVTRIIFCGSGKVGVENETEFVPYQISQRADFFETEIGLDTMVKRPIINTRDEPHANRDKYRRLHVIVGDSNMSEYTIYLKMGTTSIVLSMIEDQFLEKSLVLRNPVKALKAISRDLTCRRPVELDNGQKMTPIDIQRFYLEQAQRYYADRPCDPITADILGKWAYVLDALATDPFSLRREVDWVIKWHLINSYIEKRGEAWNSSRVAMMDLQYHDIRPDKGLYYILQRSGEVERIVTDEEIRVALEHPPTDTRAYFRGMCLRKFRQHIFGVNWDSLSFNVDEGPIKRVLMEEPAKGSKAHVEELLARSNTVEELLVNLSL